MRVQDPLTGDEARPNSDLIQFLSQEPPPKPSTPSPADGTLSAWQRWKQAHTPGQPDPWLQRKLAVGIAIALSLWSFYVVVGRVCAPAIQGQSGQGYGRAVGAGTLCEYVILWLMFVWSYMKMLLTGPGFAKMHMPRSLPPPPNNPSTSYIPYRQPVVDDPSELAPVNNMIHGLLNGNAAGSPTPNAGGTKRTKTGKLWSEIERPVPQVDSGVRWCRFCEINKPDRTHHCRHCGTCVMQFDHHCMWIGQCVGWANHKFFVIFTFWATLFCLYIFIFLIISTKNASDIDGQIVALIVCTGFFGLFTFTMVVSHLHLVFNGKTTVESYAGRDQAEMENSALHREFGSVLRDHEKRMVRRKWKEEFGGVEVDDRWRFGTWKERWRQEMGNGWLGWILPIGHPLGDGLHFPSHPAFGPNGEWMKKRDWVS